MTLRQSIETEALAANRATAALQDDLVSDALLHAAARVREHRVSILDANAADCDAASRVVDPGTLDRLRLDETRVEGLARQVEVMAEIEPLER